MTNANQRAKATRPGYSFLICPDSQLLLRQLDIMLQNFAPKGNAWQKNFFWGDEPPTDKFWTSLRLQSLFAVQEAIIVRRANEWPASVWKNIDQALASANHAVWPVFCLEVEWEKGKFRIPAHILKSSAYGYAENKKWLWSRQRLAQGQLSAYVREEARLRNLSFDNESLAYFCENIRPDAAAIGNELDKLALLEIQGPITSAMLGLDSSAPENDAFACVKKLLMGDLEAVWQELARTNASSFLFFLIALLAREFRALWDVACGVNIYLHPSDAQFKRQLARSLGTQGIGQAFCHITEAEWRVKSGQNTPEQALEILVSSIYALVKAPKNSR